MVRADPRAIAGRLARLFLRFRSSQLNDANSEAVIAAYVSDLQKFPIWAIDRAMLGVIDKGGAFAPSGPELRAACERAMIDVVSEASNIRTILDAEVYHEQTAEQRARVKVEFDKLTEELGMRDPPKGQKPEYRLPTKQEAEMRLEEWKASPPAIPPLSDSARKTMGLPPREQEGEAA